MRAYLVQSGLCGRAAEVNILTEAEERREISSKCRLEVDEEGGKTVPRLSLALQDTIYTRSSGMLVLRERINSA